MTNFEDQFEQDKKEHSLSGSDFLNIKEDSNRMRILAEPKIIVERYKYGICYKGAEYCKKEVLEKENSRLQYRYLTWIIDRLDGRIKLFKMPYTIAKSLVGLKTAKDDGYGFDSFPMPYDINIKATNAGTKQVNYSLLPLKESALMDHELADFEKQTEIDDIIERMKQKQMDKIGGNPHPKEELDEIEYPEDQEEVDAF